MAIEIEEQYDKIYRYCFFKLHNRAAAEDVTQEAFLRYLEHYKSLTEVSALKCLYTIARNLCVDEYRRAQTEMLEENIPEIGMESEEQVLVSFSIRKALSGLTVEEQELLLLRYVNEVPMEVIAKLYDISRFAAYRKLKNASRSLREELRKEGLHE